MRHLSPRSFFQALGATVLLVLVIQVGQAEVMSSSNFKMQSDSINPGGDLSDSENYRMEDTLGELATGNGSSTNFNLRAGYQQMQSSYISLSAIPDVVLSPNLGGVTSGSSTGSTTFTVITDSAAGYTVTIEASTSPAMRSGANTIADYVPGGGVPDFLFTTDANEAHLAFSPQGVDVAVRFQDNGSVCGVSGSDTVNRCFDGLSTSPVEIVRGSSGNHPTGATTSIQFRVGIGGLLTVPEGVYTATTTITALSL
jgi:hypothetical protein